MIFCNGSGPEEQEIMGQLYTQLLFCTGPPSLQMDMGVITRFQNVHQELIGIKRALIIIINLWI